MVQGGVECILGVRRDPVLGVVLLLGAGGVHVELLGDVAFRLAPVDRPQAPGMIADLHIAPRFCGYRGAPAAVVADPVASLVRSSQSFVALSRVVYGSVVALQCNYI